MIALALFSRFAVGLNPCEVLQNFLFTVRWSEGLIAIAVAGTVKAFAYKVENTGISVNVMLHLETPEIVAIHYDKLPATTTMLWHDIIAFASLQMCFVSNFDCLA